MCAVLKVATSACLHPSLFLSSLVYEKSRCKRISVIAKLHSFLPEETVANVCEMQLRCAHHLFDRSPWQIGASIWTSWPFLCNCIMNLDFRTLFSIGFIKPLSPLYYVIISLKNILYVLITKFNVDFFLDFEFLC